MNLSVPSSSMLGSLSAGTCRTAQSTCCCVSKNHQRKFRQLVNGDWKRASMVGNPLGAHTGPQRTQDVVARLEVWQSARRAPLCATPLTGGNTWKQDGTANPRVSEGRMSDDCQALLLQVGEDEEEEIKEETETSRY
uniref:Uncharacterized protein n=1 Tax=Eutreptiella gymnastica TaxID=73025 RepID=A0A7S4LCS5_9EUGL